MQTHTPGPWAANYNGTCWQIDAAMDAVATTQFCYAPETEANARLIAAAPRMHSLIERFLDAPSDDFLLAELRREGREIMEAVSGRG